MPNLSLQLRTSTGPVQGLRLLRRKGSAGFTFIELAAVIIIMGMLLLLVMPSMDGLTVRLRLQSAARRLASESSLARSQAILTGRTYGLRYDLDNNRFWVALPKTGEDDLTYFSEQDGEFVEHGRASTSEWYLPKGVRFKDISFGDEAHQSGLIYVEVPPFGSGFAHLIHLESVDGDEQTVEVNGLTGLAEIHRGYKVIEEYHEEPDESP